MTDLPSVEEDPAVGNTTSLLQQLSPEVCNYIHSLVYHQHVSLITHTKMTGRQWEWDQTRLKNSVRDDHPMAGVLISAGIWPNGKLGYPTTDNTFCTLLGESVPAFDKVGNVFDLEGIFLGSVNPNGRW